MTSIFLSHASADVAISTEICAEIESVGLKVWASFRDIKAGANWDKEIERAIFDCTCMVVICSPASVESSYVRAEVEGALRQDKTVIPLIVSDCELPLRWKMLQSIQWDKTFKAETIRRLRDALPETALSSLRKALEDSDGLEEIKKILSAHSEWLPLEHWMRPEYYIKCGERILSADPVDVFAARMDSMGPRGYMYYFGPHNVKPFLRTGEPCEELADISALANWHVLNIRKPLSKNHPFLPANIFAPEKSDWRIIGDYYRSLEVFVVFGRRKHYAGKANKYREQLISSEGQRWTRRVSPMEVKLELMSYDRLIESIEKRRS